MMSFPSSCQALLVLVVALCPGIEASSEAFLLEHKKGLRARVNVETFQSEVLDAMGEALGCGSQVSEEHLQALEEALKPTYRTLPKNSNGRLERRSLRYLAYRYFNERSSLIIRGFEPSRPVNESHWNSAAILSQHVPGFVESVLESKHKEIHGFDLRDAAFMVATLEQLVFDSERILLEKVYDEQRKPSHRALGKQGLGQLLESYLVHWMMGDDLEGVNLLLGNRSLLATAFPHWDLLVSFAHGQIEALDYERQKKPLRTAPTSGGNALSSRYSFDDVHSVVGGITTSFGSFWESECINMKEQLVAMDTHHTGRVPLSKFYGSALDTEWRFGESESYLRELGALDETSSWGKQVIIPNYIQGASNCIVNTPHYMICCANDCLSIMTEIDVAVGTPMAEPALLLRIVGNMSTMTSLEDETDVQVGGLKGQLESIAAAHNGKVPIHGRLFAQWLHYAFPRECPFPHKSGTALQLTPSQFGEGYIASDVELMAHASQRNSSGFDVTAKKEDLQWMSQWSEEEELIGGHQDLAKAEAPRKATMLGFALFVCAGLLGIVGVNRKTAKSDFLLPTYSKTHFV